MLGTEGDFTILSTEDRTLAGTYTVSLKGYIDQPDDYTESEEDRRL